ncbi:MAG: chemotaxis protein CheW [Dehalococcoidia bacterium]|nr:chemotaxis protein CheW [Dehalococcoidia bacterium]
MADEAVEEAESDEQQLVVFTLNTESYGVDIGSVREIIRMLDITRVPRTPAFVEGVINLRGKIVPVVDLRHRFGFPTGERDKESRIVVVDTGGQDVGMVVDAVTEVLRISSDSVEPPSNVVTGTDTDYLRGIVKLEGRLVILLDLDRVLSSREVRALRDTARTADAAM